MMMKIFQPLFLLVNLGLFTQVFSASPVLLWSNVNLPQLAVPFSTISSHRLITDYICEKVTKKQIQVRVLAVSDLSLEDIQYGAQSDHSLLVEAKSDETNFRFYPNVADDFSKKFASISASNNLKCSHIHFETISSKTYESLSDALDVMQATIDNLGSDRDTSVIIALTNSPSDSPKLARHRRQAASNDSNVFMSKDKTCMFYAQRLVWNNATGVKLTGQNYTLNFDASTCISNTTDPKANETTLTTLNLVWTNIIPPFDVVNMKLITTIIGRYWYLENATIDSTEYRYFAYGMHDQMVTPPSYSYVCNSAVFVQYDSSGKYGQYNFTNKFYLVDLQFQPFRGDGLVFGAPNYCNSFFTSGIWMGIWSSLLCLAILLFGVHRMMSIKSNDRFDDPRGKPLLIKAHE